MEHAEQVHPLKLFDHFASICILGAITVLPMYIISKNNKHYVNAVYQIKNISTNFYLESVMRD